MHAKRVEAIGCSTVFKRGGVIGYDTIASFVRDGPSLHVIFDVGKESSFRCVDKPSLSHGRGGE